MCGAAVISSSTLSVFKLCCDGALHFPQFFPAVLKPDLTHKNMQTNIEENVRMVVRKWKVTEEERSPRPRTRQRGKT